MNYQDKRCLITGGASFIGSHLADLLLRAGASVTIVDDLSSGKISNIGHILSDVRYVEGSIGNHSILDQCLPGNEIVFHLAAIHGGRGFIDKYPQKMMENLSLDFAVFSKSLEHGIRRIVHASSACAYPTEFQSSSTDLNYLQEAMANFNYPNGSFPDGAYGWTKLMGEYQLLNMSNETTSGRSARIFTAYGSRENESHAMVALVAKALLRIDPYPIWGDGFQTRNFTHVLDTVKGLAFLGLDDRPVNFDVFNIGTSNHQTVIDVVEEIFRQTDWEPQKIDFQLDRPTGVKSRASNNQKIKEIFGWEPEITIETGIAELISWYRATRLSEMTPSKLADLLDSR
jgi:nucleoside-diphosphate-sugar epimerase